MLYPQPSTYHDTIDRTANISLDTQNRNQLPAGEIIYRQSKGQDAPAVPSGGSGTFSSPPGNTSDHRFSLRLQIGETLQWYTDRSENSKNTHGRQTPNSTIITQGIRRIDTKKLKREAFELALAIRDFERKKLASEDDKTIAQIERQIENAKIRLKAIAAVSPKLHRFVMKRATPIFEREDTIMNQFQACLSEIEALESENMRSDEYERRKKEIHAKMIQLARLDTRVRHKCEELSLRMKTSRERDTTRRKRDHKGAQRRKFLEQEKILEVNFQYDPREPIEIEDPTQENLDAAFSVVIKPLDNFDENAVDLFYSPDHGTNEILTMQLDAIRDLTEAAGAAITPALIEESCELGRIPELALAIQRNVSAVRRLAHAMLEDIQTAM